MTAHNNKYSKKIVRTHTSREEIGIDRLQAHESHAPGIVIGWAVIDRPYSIIPFE